MKQYQIEERRKQVVIMIAQGMTEVEIGRKLGADASTISTDIKAVKLISQQFIYDITKSIRLRNRWPVITLRIAMSLRNLLGL